MGYADVVLSVTLTSIDCGKCGGTYAINERYRQQKHEEGGTWACPYCQIGWGYEEGELARVQKQLESELKRREWAEKNVEHARRQVSAARGQVTRVRNRVANGVCPCCNRTFANVARHMKSKHPEYLEPEGGDPGA